MKELKLSWFSVLSVIIMIIGVIFGLIAGSESYGPLHPFELSRNLIYILLIIICVWILKLERHKKYEKYIWLCLAGSATLNTIGSLLLSLFQSTGTQNQFIMMLSSLVFFFAYLTLILGLIFVVVSLQKKNHNKSTGSNGALLVIIFVALIISYFFIPAFRTTNLPSIEKIVYAIFLSFDVIIIFISVLIFWLLAKEQTLRLGLSVFDYICFGITLLACYHIFIFFSFFTGTTIHINFNILRMVIAIFWVIGCDAKLQELISQP